MLASPSVIVARLLSLLVLAAALVAVHGTYGGAPTITERIDLSDDGSDVPMFVPRIAPLARPTAAGRSYLEAHRAPATPPVASRIFRPPISPLA